jgi:hypothetical protein
MPANKQLRKEWEKAGYSTGVGSAIVLPPPPAGYRRVYHLAPAEYAISNIVFSRLKVARFSDLNDPFELLAHRLVGTNIQKIIEAHKAKFDSTQGLLCFSADWVDPVLWTHYGAKHRGICLGFDLDETIARQVSYQNERLVGMIERGTEAIDEKLSNLILCTKFESWQYEREWRVLVDLADVTQEGDLYFYPFGAQLRLTEVILGSLCAMSVDAVRKLTTAHHPGAVTIQARLALKSFHIVPKESTIP